MRTIVLPGLAGLAFAGATAVSIPAQTVPTRTLSRPEARLEQEWSRVIAIRELSDRRVIVLDNIENTIMLVNSGLTSSRRIGREGQGPGEFFNPSALLPLGGDSTGVYDNSNRSLKAISPAGEPGGLLYPSGGAPCREPGDTTRRAFVTPHVDASGRFYTVASNVRRLPDGTLEQTDASAIERWGRGCGRDTMGYIPRRIDPTARIMPGGAMISRASPTHAAFPAFIQWVPSPDGRVAIVHPDPYRVDIVGLNGTVRQGTPIAFRPIRVGEAHRVWYREQMGQLNPGIQVTRDGAVSRRLMPSRAQEPDTWPSTLPPFLRDAVSMGLDGRLWVQRTTEDLNRPEFDIFDVTGRLVERVVFPARTRLVGHGRDVVYLVRVDEDDLEYLERHRVR
ncbi:MAG: hypothetical protein ABR551_09480 [Gemmatimonadales bacterium]